MPVLAIERMIKIRTIGLAFGLLLSAGVVHRWTHATRTELAGIVRPLSAALSDIPSRLGRFNTTREITMDADVLRVANTDEYIQREYADRITGARMVLYVGYWGRENVGLGHGPEVCYPAHGWDAVGSPGTRGTSFAPSEHAKQTVIAFHRFTRVEPIGVARRAVGFVAVLDGAFQISSRKSFWHRPGNRDGGGHYLAHIFVSTAVPDNDWETAESEILAFMDHALPHVWACLRGPSDLRS